MPCIVFKPRQDLLNPHVQPAGDGTWQFLSDDDRATAALNLGGQQGYGFPDEPHPNADAVWMLREKYAGRYDEGGTRIDPTESLDLVWQYKNPADVTDEEVAKTQADQGKSFREDIGHGFDTHTGLAHDPTNGGGYDQTALNPESACYQTRLFETANGKLKITLDRASINKPKDRKAPCIPEPNKLWSWDGSKWLKWTHFAKLENGDGWPRDIVAKLDKWRDQSCNRANWPKKRTNSSGVAYTNEQKKYVFELVDKENGKVPFGRAGDVTAKEFAQDFNTKFRLQGEDMRTSAGVEALVRKMCTEYNKNGGKFPAPVKSKRGPKKATKQIGEMEVMDEQQEKEQEQEQPEGDSEDAPGETDDEMQ